MLKTTPEERYAEAVRRGEFRQDGTDGGTQARPGDKRANGKEEGMRIPGKEQDN